MAQLKDSFVKINPATGRSILDGNSRTTEGAQGQPLRLKKKLTYLLECVNRKITHGRRRIVRIVQGSQVNRVRYQMSLQSISYDDLDNETRKRLQSIDNHPLYQVDGFVSSLDFNDVTDLQRGHDSSSPVGGTSNPQPTGEEPSQTRTLKDEA